MTKKNKNKTCHRLPLLLASRNNMISIYASTVDCRDCHDQITEEAISIGMLMSSEEFAYNSSVSDAVQF